MNLDACTLYKYATDKDSFIKLGFDLSLLEPKYQKVIPLLDEHISYGKLPAAEDLEKLFGEPMVEQTELAPEWLVKQLKRRRMHFHVGKLIDAARTMHLNNNPEGAIEILENGLELIPDSSDEQIAKELTASIDDVVENTKSAALGTLGLPSPWKGYNDTTGGVLPAQTTWFAARPGIGKTWILLVLCVYYWMLRFEPGGHKIKILFVSPELRRTEVAERALAFATQCSYAKASTGQMGTFEQQDYFEKLDAFRNTPDFLILTEEDNPTPERIKQVILKEEPDIIAIDAAYEILWTEDKRVQRPYDVGVSLIRKWGRTKWPSTREPLWPVKDQPDYKWVHILASTQANRDGEQVDKKGKKVEVPLSRQIALSDRIFFTGDNVFILDRTRDEQLDHKLLIKRVKVRKQGANLKEVITLRWNLDTMDFSEVGDTTVKHEDEIPTF